MVSLKQLRGSPLYRPLRESPGFRQARNGCIFWGSFAALLTVLEICLCFTQPRTEYFTLTDVAYYAVTLALYLAFAYRLYGLARIFSHMDRYTVSEVVLDRPHMRHRRSLTYTVTLNDRDGREIQAETTEIGIGMAQDLSDYVNRRALAAYNDQTGLAVLLEIRGDGVCT